MFSKGIEIEQWINPFRATITLKRLYNPWKRHETKGFQ